MAEMDHPQLARVTAEIEGLHRFFVEWFTGVIPRSDELFERRYASRFAPECLLIPPAGITLDNARLAQAIRDNYGKSPGFAIAIRRVVVRWQRGDTILATYEEWQRNARKSKPPQNGRAATVLFADHGERLKWLHIHETWLPAEVMAAGSYDF